MVQAEWERSHDVTAYNLGIRVDSTSIIRRHWRAEWEARLPAGSNGHFVFMFGGNDAKGIVGKGVEVPMSETKPYPRLLPQASAYRFSNQRQAQYTQGYSEVARELGVPFLDVYTPLKGDPEWE